MSGIPMCRCCGQPLPSLKRGGVYMPPMKAKIYDAIQKHPGITTEQLTRRFYGEDSRLSRGRIRTHVTQINDLLVGTEITVSGDGAFRHGNSGYGRGEYRLVRG